MKQTNNAIKFLMAQYRAIFQNAYFKGLATAAVVTMGLAAGQAQAASALTITDEAGWQGITAGEHSGTVSLTSGATNDNVQFVLTLTGNSNKIDATTAEGAVSATQGTIKLDAAGSKLTIGASASDKGTTATFKKLEIQSGGIVDILQTATKGSKLIVDEVVIGSGKIQLTGADTSGANLGKEGVTTYSLGEGSEIVLNANALVVGKSLSSNGGKLSFKDDNTWTIPNYVEGSTGTAQKQNITVDAEKTGTIALVGNDTAKKRGVMDFASGSVIELASHATSGGILAIDSGSTALGSLVILREGVNLNTSGSAASGGTISVKGVDSDSAEKISTLKTDAAVLGNFLKGTVKGSVILDAHSELAIDNRTVKFGTATALTDTDLTLQVSSITFFK